MVNIVTLANGRKYMVDVGFGGNGPTQPLQLDSERFYVKNIAPADVRLVYDNIPENTNRSQKLWIYQHRIDAQSPWLPMYCFTELEFLPQDYETMNFQTSQSRTSWFTYKIVVIKMILEEGEIVGTLMLVGGDLKRRIKGETEDLKACKTEEDRVQALEEWFGLKLGDDERAGIRGMVTELRG